MNIKYYIFKNWIKIIIFSDRVHIFFILYKGFVMSACYHDLKINWNSKAESWFTQQVTLKCLLSQKKK